MSWPFILGVFIGLSVFLPIVLRRRGYTMRGRFETNPHVCHPPTPRRNLPPGTRWECRRCGKSWTLDTKHASWRCRRCSVEWKHEGRLLENPGPWNAQAKRIAAMERELGLGDG